MPAINLTDLNNAKLDVDHIGVIATSLNLTATDRIGRSKLTVQGAVNTLAAFNPRGAFAGATAYALKDVYSNGGIAYVAVMAHVSTSVASDLGAGKVTVHQGATREDLAGPSGSMGIGYESETVQDVLDSAKVMQGYTALRAYTGRASGVRLTTQGIAGFFQRSLTDASADNGGVIIVDAAGRRWLRLFSGAVNVQWFGALGNNDQTLFATNYVVDGVTITQQTADALAFNRAIVYLQSIGGLALYVPRGLYRIYGYLERIGFHCHISGDGEALSVLKNCDTSPTNVNGYGIAYVNPAVLSLVAFKNITLDGNATVRAKPTSELRCYPLGWYGSVNAHLTNVTCKDSPIDCMMTAYDNNLLSSLQAVNLTLSNSFRNTLSLVMGWNQQYSNCIIEKGGKVQGGTNPKYCLDIEPNSSALPIKNITFSNSIFREAENVIAGGAWAGNVKFIGCSFDAYGSTVANQPWLGNWRGGEFTFSGCTFSDAVTYTRFFKCDNPMADAGEFSNLEHVTLTGCSFKGVGLQGFGREMSITDCTFKNSKYPVHFTGGGVQRLTIKNLTLINVVDSANFGAGRFSGFSIEQSFEGYLDIDGLSIRFAPDLLPPNISFDVSGAVYGIYLAPTLSGAEGKVSNVHVAGFYQKYPSLYGKTLSPTSYRDWNFPGLPPADTAGQTAGPGAIYYRNCTAYGNSA